MKRERLLKLAGIQLNEMDRFKLPEPSSDAKDYNTKTHGILVYDTYVEVYGSDDDAGVKFSKAEFKKFLKLVGTLNL